MRSDERCSNRILTIREFDLRLVAVRVIYLSHIRIYSVSYFRLKFHCSIKMLIHSHLNCGFWPSIGPTLNCVGHIFLFFITGINSALVETASFGVFVGCQHIETWVDLEQNQEFSGLQLEELIQPKIRLKLSFFFEFIRNFVILRRVFSNIFKVEVPMFHSHVFSHSELDLGSIWVLYCRCFNTLIFCLGHTRSSFDRWFCFLYRTDVGRTRVHVRSVSIGGNYHVRCGISHRGLQYPLHSILIPMYRMVHFLFQIRVHAILPIHTHFRVLHIPFGPRQSLIPVRVRQ